ncbi:hypothetical protein [Xenorhabdus sp. SGI240]|uniref:hypothetical protein n=1 Tax=Xenorhabdus sp. SGI240 TaxID=3158262 RepID=UPI0032B746E5
MTTQTTSKYDSVTKFMKSYELNNLEEYYAVGGFENIENKNGEIEIFFKGGGIHIDNIINLCPDINNDSGYTSKPLSLESDMDWSPSMKHAYTTTFDNGRIALFSIYGNGINYIYENVNTEKERWSSVKTFPFPYDIEKTNIDDMQVKCIRSDNENIEGERIYILLVLNGKNDPNITVSLFDNPAVEDNSPHTVLVLANKEKLYNKKQRDCTNLILTGNTTKTAAIDYIVYNHKYQRKHFAYNRYTFHDESFTVKNYDDIDGDFESDIIKIDELTIIYAREKLEEKMRSYCNISTEDFHQYIISLNLDKENVSIRKIFSNQSIDKNITIKEKEIVNFKPSVDGNTHTHIFIKYNPEKSSGENKSELYHIEEYEKSPSGWSNPIMINQSVMEYNPISTESGEINVFLVDMNSDKNVYIRSMWSHNNDQWINSNITPGSKKVIKELSVYSSEISVKDKFGILLINEPVEISSSAQTKLIINGSTYFVEEDQKISIKTNMRGIFTITQPAENLGVTALSFTLPQRDPSPIAIRQYADVKDRLSKLTAQELKGAKDSKGNLLVPDLSTDNAESIVSSVKKCMEMADTVPKLRRTLKKEPHVGKYLTETLLQLETLQVPKQYQSWMLDLSNSTPIYRELNKDVHQKEIANVLNRGIIEWFGCIGDFIKNAINNIIDVVKIIVYSTPDGFKAIIHFVEDGIEKFFTAVIKVAIDAMNIASVVFNYIKLTVDKLIEWIGFVFDWDDILRTKEAISHILSLQKEFLTKSTGKVNNYVDNKFIHLQNEVNQSFDNCINTYKGKSIKDGYTQFQSLKNSYAPKDMDKALANNPLIDYLSNPNSHNELSKSLNVVQSRFISIDDDDGSQIKYVGEKIEAYADDFEDSDDMNALKALFHDSENTETFLSKRIEDILEILKNITNSAIKKITKLVDSIIAFVETAFSKFDTIMNEPLYIPFVSEMFKFITKSKKNPSMNDFLSLLIAIPTTILSKLILHRSLFPDEESVLQFKAEINITDLLKILNSIYNDNDSMVLIKNTGKTKRKKRSTINSSGFTATTLKWISAICTLLSGIFEGLRSALVMIKKFYPNNTLHTRISRFIKCFAVGIAAINVCCLLFSGSLDIYSVLLIATSLFMLVLSIAYIFASFYLAESEIYDTTFIVISSVFGVVILLATVYNMDQLDWWDRALGFIFAAWQLLDLVALSSAVNALAAAVAIQCLLGVVAGGIKIYKIVK